MFISEVGIILNGVSILNHIYDKGKNILAQNADLRNSLLDAILKMSAAVLNEEIHHFTFKKYKLFIKTSTLKATKTSNVVKFGQITDLVIYCIGDTELNQNIISPLLASIEEEFIKMYPDVADNPSGDISQYYKFVPTFDRILSDLGASPQDRFEDLF
ncbi:MAG: hypothetical protein GF364_06105 [Candidatus Lokiarchaeota archaeon]|nr:hypothetical protein [Candidatus Lokiarchaeota archaeon]